MSETPLGAKLRATGDAALIDLADKFEAATAGYYGDPQTVDVKMFLGHYARARMAWCKHSGEPLV